MDCWVEQEVASALSREPERSIPGACRQWSEVLGAYRFADQQVILVAQDTTFLGFESSQPKEGFGTLKRTVREEHLLHVNVAVQRTTGESWRARRSNVAAHGG